MPDLDDNELFKLMADDLRNGKKITISNFGTFEVSKVYDGDMIEYLDSVDNRTGTIKAAIREKMERGGRK